MTDLKYVQDNIKNLIGFKVFVEKPIGYCMSLEECATSLRCPSNKPCKYSENVIVKLKNTKKQYKVIQQIRLDSYLNQVGEGDDFQVSCDIFYDQKINSFYIVTKGMFLSGQRSARGNTYLKNVYDLLQISKRNTVNVSLKKYQRKSKKRKKNIPERKYNFHSGLYDYSKAIFTQILERQLIPPKSNIHIMGHSMGSAISQILGFMIKYMYPEHMKRISVLAVGSPRVIDKNWCNFYNNNKSLKKKLKYYRVANYSENKKYTPLNIPHITVKCKNNTKIINLGSVDPVVTFPSHTIYGNPGKLYLIGKSRSCKDPYNYDNLISGDFSYDFSIVNNFDVSLYNLWKGFGLHFGLESFLN